MRKIIAFFWLFAGLAIVGPAYGQSPLVNAPWAGRPLNDEEQTHLANLDRLLAARDHNGLFDLAVRFAGPDITFATMEWAKTRVSEGAGLPVVLIYARVLWNVAMLSTAGLLRDTSGSMTLYALLVTLADGTKCADLTAIEGRLRTILGNYQQQTRYLAELPSARLEAAISAAIRLEAETAPKRGNDDWLCRDGIQATIAHLKRHGENALRATPGDVGTNIAIADDPSYQPQFKPREEWEPTQAEIRKVFPTFLKKIVPTAPASP